MGSALSFHLGLGGVTTKNLGSSRIWNRNSVGPEGSFAAPVEPRVPESGMSAFLWVATPHKGSTTTTKLPLEQRAAADMARGLEMMLAKVLTEAAPERRSLEECHH